MRRPERTGKHELFSTQPGLRIMLVLIAAFFCLAFQAAAGDDGKAAAGKEGAAAGDGKGLKPELSAAIEKHKNTVLAEVNGKKITVNDFETAARRASPMQIQELGTPQGKKKFLDQMIRMWLLAQKARAAGLDKDPEAVRVMKNQLASIMHRELASKISEDDVTEAEMREFYDSHAENYHKPAKTRARVIMLKDRAQAKELLDRLTKDKPSQHEFRRLAQENSEDEETRLRGGDLRFFTRAKDRKESDPKVDEAIVQAAFSLKNDGDIYPKLIKANGGFNVLMRTGFRKPLDISFKEAKPRLKMLVYREKRRVGVEEELKKLQDKSKIEYIDDNLSLVKIDMRTGQPGARRGPGRARKPAGKKRPARKKP